MEDKNTDRENEAPDIDMSVPMKPFADPVMEAVFANKEVAGLAAQSLINAVLADSGDPLIGEIILLTPQKSMPNILSRGYRLDIEARTGDREVVDMEVQLRYMDMNNRGILYAGSMLSDSAQRGAKMETVLAELPRVIIINILHFDLRKKHTDYHQPAELMYRKPTAENVYERASDRMAIHNIELKKFMEHTMPGLIGKTYNKDTSALQYWLWALCTAHEENKTLEEVINTNAALAEFAKQDTGFIQYTERLEEISTDQQVRRMYAIWTEGMSALDQAHMEGHDEGYAEGSNQKAIQAVVKMIKKWQCPLTEAMEEMELDQQYRINVIEELEKQGVSYTE